MDGELVAAITFAAALAAVMLEQMLLRRRSRRERIERSILAVSRDMAMAVTGLSASVTVEESIPGTEHWAALKRVLDELLQIRTDAKGLPLSKARTIRDAADDLSARLGAAQLRVMDGDRLTIDEVSHLLSDSLRHAAFGDMPNLIEAVGWYRENGFQQRAPKHVYK